MTMVVENDASSSTFLQNNNAQCGGYNSLKSGSISDTHSLLDSESTRSSSQYEEEQRSSWCRLPPIKKNALYFAIRMATLLCFSSIFVIIKNDSGGSIVPQGKWIMITVLFVSWFPSLDAASVVKKSMDRLAGTFVGAALGLICGFISELFPTNVERLLFLQACTAAIPLGVILAFTHITKGNSKRTLLQEHNYAAILCLLTFFLAVFPFSIVDGTTPYWHFAIWRIINVILGCLISAVGSIIILPRSTEDIIQQKIQAQIQSAGESAEATMHAAVDTFEGMMEPLKLADEILESSFERNKRLRSSVNRSQSRFVRKEAIDEEGNLAIAKYDSAIQDWKDTKALLQMLKFDPFHMSCGGGGGGVIGGDEDENNILHEDWKENFCQHVANTLARAHRVQTTLLLLDGIVRNEPRHKFTDVHLGLFADIGSLIRKMFQIPYDEDECSLAAEELFEKLPLIRNLIILNSSAVADSPAELPGTPPELQAESSFSIHKDKPGILSMSFRKRISSVGGDSEGRGFPKFVRGSHVCANLFLQLVEHLTVRSLKLYQSWQKVEEYYDGDNYF